MAFWLVERSTHSNSSVLQNAAETLKVLLLSVGLISTLLMVKTLMPFSCEIVFSNLMGFWNSIRCLFSSPLYICIIINSMVLLIAASSTFHRHDSDNHHHPPPPPEVEQPPPETLPLSRNEGSDHDHDHEIKKIDHDHDREIKKTAELLIHDSDQVSEKQLDKKEKEEEEEEEEEEDTMEATWKAINGAKRKQLKKSQTWLLRSSLQSEGLPAPSTSTWKDLRKSETFNEAVSMRRIGGLRRDPSTGIDEFNQKVEAFIKNFNENMRLQRQESDQRFLDMVNRGL